MLDQTGNSYSNSIKPALWNSIYMDNGSYTTNDPKDLQRAYAALPKIFEPYQFKLQQFFSNCEDLQVEIDSSTGECSPREVKLFGLFWDRVADTLAPTKIEFDESLCTKRQILGALNEVYDLFNVYAPILLRAKIFMQNLQLNKSLDWDTKVPVDLQKEWINISRQINSTPQIAIERSFGDRNGTYSLLCFTDASAFAYACCIYLKNEDDGKTTYVTTKNKLLSSNLKKKSMPSLELQGIEYGIENMMEIYDSLAGDSVVLPIKIKSMNLWSDSSACLHWLEAHSIKFDKTQKLSVFVNNRLNNIEAMCQKFPVSFRHIAGEANPSDCATRPISYKVLQKTRFFEGPEFLNKPLHEIAIDTVFNIPNPFVRRVFEPDRAGSSESDGPEHEPVLVQSATSTPPAAPPQHLVAVDRVSDFTRLVRVVRLVMKYVHNLKVSIQFKKSGKIDANSPNFYESAYSKIIQTEQELSFPEVFAYFRSGSKLKKDIPDLVNRLNLYIDKNGIFYRKIVG